MNEQADDSELTEAVVMYHLAYHEELPLRNYTKADIQYIIEQCNVRLQNPDVDLLKSDIIH